MTNMTPAQSAAALSHFAGGTLDALRSPPAFVEWLPIAIYACDAEGRILWFNRRAAELWGRAPRLGEDGEIFCGSYRLIFNGKVIGREETPMAMVLRTGAPIHGVEGIVERPDGTQIWAMVHIDPIRDTDGTLIGAVNCFHETTETHRAHEELVRSERRFAHLYQSLPMGVYACDPNGIVFRYNKKATELWGQAPAAGDPSVRFCGAHKVFRLDGTLLLLDEDPMRQMLIDRKPVRDFEAILERPDGSRITVLANLDPIVNPDGVFIGGVNCFQDISELKRAQESLRTSEKQMRDLMEALPAAVYTTDADGKVTYFNQAAADLAGRTPTLGSDEWCVTWKLYNPDGTPLSHDECPMAVALKENRAVRGTEAVAERPDGTRVPFLPFPTPLRDNSGSLTGAVNMLIDISERKEAETQQRALFSELHHRVKNNLQMLYSLLQTAQRETPGEEARAVLTEAGHRVAAMAAAQRVLYSGASPNHFESRAFLDSVCANVRLSQGHERDIVITKAEGMLPNDTAVPLALILNELLTNAVKYGKPVDGRAHSTIRVGLTHAGNSFVLAVEDDGPGFDQGDARKRASGLGLVGGLVRQLGGTFEVERAPGARCVVQFPDRRRGPL